MLGKLIKHDFRALSRTLFPLQVGLLGGGILASVFFTINMRLSTMPTEVVSTGVKTVLTVVTALFMGIVFLCIAASALVTLLLVCIQFYRNLMGSQGYLSFTLPVTTGRTLWSKLITGMIWVVINLCVIVVTVLIFAVFGTASSGFMNPAVVDALREFWDILFALGTHSAVPLIAFEGIVYVLIALGTSILQAYLAIGIGGRATKHRLLASVGMYMAMSMAANTISTVLIAFLSLVWPRATLLSFSTEAMTAGLIHVTLIGGSLISAAYGALYFIFTRLLLKNKLNLQ